MTEETFVTHYSHPFIFRKDEYSWSSQGVKQTWETDLETLAKIPELDQVAPREVHYLGGTTHRVGRCESDLLIRHHTVSAHHGGLFHMSSESGAVGDFGSTNGTFLNGWRVPAHTNVPLLDKDKITFGGVLYTFMLAPTAYNFGRFIGERIGAAKVETPVSDGEIKPKPTSPEPPKEPRPPADVAQTRTDRLPVQLPHTNMRHPAAQPIGKPPKLGDLMSKALKEKQEKIKALTQRHQHEKKLIWFVSNLPKILAAIFMLGALAYALYAFFIGAS